jgi:hypothetical protein
MGWIVYKGGKLRINGSPDLKRIHKVDFFEGAEISKFIQEHVFYFYITVIV